MANGKPIRVLLADDHAIVRAGIRSMLRTLEGIQVAAEAGDGREALRMIERHRPDVALLDIAMPELNGLETAARVTGEFPGVRVIMLSVHVSEEYALQALRAGALGYVMKDADAPELELAIRTVCRGETYLSPAVSQHVVADYIRRVGRGGQEAHDPLTPRQREVLRFIAEGRSTKEIAHDLGLSPKTVETHRAQLMKRLKIDNVVGLVHYAIRIGLVTPDR